MKRILVTGGRHYSNYEHVRDTLARLCLKDTIIIEGGATGADACARRFSTEVLGRPSLRYNAEWTKYKNDAGAIRNQRMLTQGQPTVVVAFPGNRGTADMVERAQAAGIEVIFA